MADIPTVNLDSGADRPGLARAELLQAVQAVNALRRTVRTVKDLDFGAAGDGTTSDQAAVEAAVSAAFASGDDLWWPDGTYLTTANIPSLHSVRHFGPGAIKRGANLFYVEPKTGQTNTIYVAATGGATTNDGLSSSEAISTVQLAGNVLYNYPSPDAGWTVQLAAGTYAQTASFLRRFPTNQRVLFTGPAVSLGTVPTAIIDSPAGTGTGIYGSGGHMLQVKDIKFTDFSVLNASGLTVDARSDLLTTNVHADNCYQGIEAASESKLRVVGGVINNCSTAGISVISNSTFTIGYNATAMSTTGANGPAITNCPGAGIFAQESATGHADYCYVNGCGVGLDVLERSRIHLLGSTISGNTTGARMRGGSSIYKNPSIANTFSGNTDDWIVGVGSYEVNADQNARPAIIRVRDTTTYATSSTSPVTATTASFAAGDIATRGAGFELELLCTVVGTAGTKNVTVTLGSTTILNRTITATSAQYTIKVQFINRTGGGSPVQKVFATVLENGVAPVITQSTSVAEDLTTAKTLTITHNVANAADTNRIQHVQLTVIR